jgi:hypothetical protein
MTLRTGLFLILAALLALAPASLPARAADACETGQICALQSSQIGCKDLPTLKNWVDLYVEQSREIADRYLDGQVESGQCTKFKTGDMLRIIRYVGMRRVEVQRAGSTERYIILLK